MAEQPHVALVRRLTDDVWNRHQVETIDELFALSTRLSADDHVESIEHFKQRVRAYLTAFPDLQVTINQLLANDTEVMVRWSARGTHTGPLTGLPAAIAVQPPLRNQDSVLRISISLHPTGHTVRFQGVSSFRVENGKITWYWLLMDELSLLRQLGAMPSVQTSGGTAI